MLGPQLVIAVLTLPALWLVAVMLREQTRMAGLYGLLLYTTFLGSLVRFGGSLHLPVLVAGVIVAIEFLLPRDRRPRERIDTFDILVIALAVWVFLVTGFRAGLAGGELASAREPMVLAAIVLASRLRPQFDREGLTVLVRCLAIGGVMVAFVCAVQLLAGTPTLYGLVTIESQFELTLIGRPTGLQGNPNAAALYLLMGFCAALGLTRGSQTTFGARAGWILCVLATSAALLMTQSRSAVLAATIVLGFQLGAVLRLGKWTPVLVLALSAFMLTVAPEIAMSLGEKLLSERDLEVTGREDRWDIAFRVLSTHPLVGEPSVLWDGHPVNYHNDVLQFACYFGLPAALLFVLALARLVWFFWALDTADPRGGHGWATLLVLSAVTIHSTFHVVLAGGIAFWMFVGLGIHNTRNRALVAGVHASPRGRTAKPRA